MKTILIGAVTTTRRVLETMIEVDFPISYVFSLDDAVIENVICDKDVVVGEGKSLKGADTYPIIVSKGATI